MGYYGYGNVGDDHCLSAAYELVTAAFPNQRIQIAVGPIPVWNRSGSAFNRWHVGHWITVLRQSQWVVYGGGSLFQSKTGLRSLLYYLGTVVLAYGLGCRVILLCHGWGPFKRRWHERLARWVLQHAKCSWRTPAAAMPGDPIWCDLTLLTDLPRQPVTFPAIGVGINLRDADQAAYLTDWCRHQGETVVQMLNQGGASSADTIRLADVWDQPKQRFRVIVTDRYHTAIWAIRHGMYWVGLSNDPKLVHLAEELQQPCFTTVADCRQFLSQHTDTFESDYSAWLDHNRSYRDAVIEWLRACKPG